MRDYGTSRLVGKDGEHIKLEVIDSNGDFSIQQGIAFGMKEHFKSIKKAEPFDLCYSVEENTFNGVTNLQLMVKDIKTN